MGSALFDLAGRVAVVSGAASGLGRAASLALADFGADLVLVDRNRTGAERTGDQIRERGRRVLVVECNVSQVDQIDSLFREVDREFGRVDFLGNIAGEGVLAKPEEISLDDVE